MYLNALVFFVSINCNWKHYGGWRSFVSLKLAIFTTYVLDDKLVFQ